MDHIGLGACNKRKLSVLIIIYYIKVMLKLNFEDDFKIFLTHLLFYIAFEVIKILTHKFFFLLISRDGLVPNFGNRWRI